jgi:2-polyprenyl-6-hydroxyphenyl methylase/3-demethylubiquinone-9 3-methyltransferase
VLDETWLATLGRFDLVYSWGVLHHTGAMWQAMELALKRIVPGGQFYIALYNDQGRPSRVWRWVKRSYCACPRLLRWIVLLPCFARLWGPTMIRDLVMLRPFRTWRNYGKSRGMSPWHDVVDWVGGYPFEVCKPEEVLDWGRRHGFELERMLTVAGGHGCNHFLLGDRRVPSAGTG